MVFVGMGLVGGASGCGRTVDEAPTAAAPQAQAGLSAAERAAAVRAVKDVLLEQASAWNHGELERFCAPYAVDARFLSPSGRAQGRAQILARYRKRYGERPETMGSLGFVFHDVLVDDTGDSATVSLGWSLSWPPASGETQPPREPAAGLSLVSLRRSPAGAWRIVADASF